MADSAETDSLYNQSYAYESQPSPETASSYGSDTADKATSPSFDDGTKSYAPTSSYDAIYPGIVIDADDADHAEALPQSGGLIAREIIETFLLTLLIFWVVNTMTGRFRIEGSSMMPTMQEGEYVLINKMAYWLNEPDRGDIIVLHYPRDPTRDFIKRIIGVPGDVVEIKDNQTVSVNGTVLSEPYINAIPSYGGRWEVPEGQVFVLGDNRNNSSDSHTWGFLDEELIVGKGWAVYWPVNQVERISHFDHNVNESPIMIGGQ